MQPFSCASSAASLNIKGKAQISPSLFLFARNCFIVGAPQHCDNGTFILSTETYVILLREPLPPVVCCTAYGMPLTGWRIMKSRAGNLSGKGGFRAACAAPRV